MSDPKHELAAIGADIHVTYRRLVTLHLNPLTEAHEIMAALDQLKLYPARIDAVTGSLDTDIAAKVAAVAGPLNDQIASLTQAATDTETANQAAADAIGSSVSALETAAGVAPPEA